MQEVLLVIHLIVAVGIITVVLLQPSESGGLTGGSGSMSNLMAPRRTADALTRLTTLLAGLFFCTSLLLAITATSNSGKQQGILELSADQPAAIEKTIPAEDAIKAEAEEAATPKAPIAQ
ncbi:MAG: preprotein translocase subunit SecG [Bdellovibrionales bacterium]|jgi:preprotein translocase subunit SecG|nr:preprotein translocase subunit SecG [Bdellovibrionales bacterium]